MDNTLSSKAILFLTFQMTQNKRNGPSCHTFFLFVPTKEPLHPKRVSFTEEGNTQVTPNKERSNIHTVFSQWRRRWSIDSSKVWHRKHLLAKAQPLFCKRSKVRTLPHEASQAKKLNLGCAQEFQIIFEGKEARETGCKALYKDLTEKTPSFESIHLTL